MANLKELKKSMENLNESQQLDIVRILLQKNIDFSENSNGVFLNLTKLSEEELGEIQKYISYIYDQEKNLIEIENVKKEYKKNFFNVTNKEDSENEQEHEISKPY